MKARPFVKWAGGKGQLAEQLDALLPKDFQNRKDIIYVEPFVGGGAMLFHVLVKYPNISRAVVNDINADLVTCYRTIKEKPDALIVALKHLQDEYWSLNGEALRKKMFLERRDRYNQHVADDVETAALFIFLNRTCFNGLYRVNSKGLYNVPFGKAEHPLICDEGTLRADSAILQSGGIPVSRELCNLLHEREQRGHSRFLRADCHRRHGAADDEGQDTFRPVRGWFPRCGLRRGVGEPERRREFQRATAWRLDGPLRDGVLGHLFGSHRQGKRAWRAADRCRAQGVFLGTRHNGAGRAVGLDGRRLLRARRVVQRYT